VSFCSKTKIGNGMSLVRKDAVLPPGEEDAEAALAKLPDEALQSLVDDFARISASVAADARATPEMRAEHLKWRMLSAALRGNRADASAGVRAELRAWLATQRSPASPRWRSSSARTRHHVRLMLAGFIGWTLWVLYRSVGSHTVAGIDLYRWSPDDLLSNLVGPPFAVLAACLLIGWAKSSRDGLSIGRKIVSLKRPSELSPHARALHLVLYPLVLVPLGLFIILQGVSQSALSKLVVGSLVCSSPFWILLRVRDSLSAGISKPGTLGLD
jgi:hypothetical protein